MDIEKHKFLTKELPQLIKALPADAVGKWGKMNGQQMIEHVAAFFDVSSGLIMFDLVTPAEQLHRFRDFLFSEKQFKENTRAPLNVIGEEPLPLKFSGITQANENLERSIISFENYFKNNPLKKTLHPVFGELNFEEWVLLHYKHVTHHLRQFGVM